MIRRMQVVSLLACMCAPRLGAAPTDFDDHDKFVRGVLDAVGELSTTFSSVKDRDTARTAAPRIEAVCDRIEKLTKDAEKLPALTPADRRKLAEKHQKELDRLAKSVQTAAFEAGVKAQNEESFFRAVKRIQEVAKELKKIGK